MQQLFFWRSSACKQGCHSKCSLFKRLRFLSWVEAVDMEFLFCEEYDKKLLQMVSIPFSENSSTKIEDRCKNFGFIPITTLPINHRDSTKIYSVLAQTVTSYINENKSFSAIHDHFAQLGFGSELNKNFDVLISSLRNHLETMVQQCKCPRLEYLAKEEHLMELGFSDLLLQAASDLFGISIVVFTSFTSIPFFSIISKKPITVTQWLFIGASFDNNVTFFILSKNCESSISELEKGTPLEKVGKKRSTNSCCCGSKGKKPEIAKCSSSADSQYSCRCPCLKAKTPH